MISYWTEFAHSGNPSAGRDGQEVTWTNWQSTSRDAERLLILDTNRDKGIRMSNFHLTTQQLRDRFFADNSFEDQCAGFKSVFRGETPTTGELEKLGPECQF